MEVSQEQDQPVLSNIDFATEVKSDRLSLLWKVTLLLSVVLITVSITLGTISELSLPIWVFAPAVMAVFCLITQWALNHQYFEQAAVVYTLGGIAAVGVALLDTSQTSLQILPYIYVLVIFMAGLLIRPQTTFMIALMAALVSLFVPFSQLGNWDFLGGHQFFAIVLMFFSAALSAQVTGELYAVTEWALLNYQRERRTNEDLFTNKTELNRSLKRSEALSDKLKDTNGALEDAIQAAEDAKNFRGKFLANMSHELRTPLNAIIGFSETMLTFPVMYDNIDLPDTYRTDLNQIYNSGKQLLHLINDILDLAKVDAGKLEIYKQDVDPVPVAHTVATMSNGLVGTKPITLKTNIPPYVPHIWADESRFRQVLINLYSNAVKFTDEGEIVLTIETKGEEVHFSLCDTGVGIPEHKQQAIFEEFQQGEDTGGRDPRSGSGLGLTISRQLLTMMDGRLWVESTPGKGSTFHFSLPIYHEEKVPAAQQEV